MKRGRFVCFESLMKLCGLIERVEICAWTKVAGIVHICADTFGNVVCSLDLPGKRIEEVLA